eukprot:CAMPEP_0184738112 /NCGR_PEP_ID=MMETSP0315-20130426/844_1 /TAXON_ID=101924 /ORGANISM="Rhodosorus marinus, Strain UTEX LB 2760" /LENGTH=172 /DNA_ID=CAMNT_0027205691 /DNA_START=69 /DNA_END=587 /DNA_ORIENTATION=-
MATFVVLGGKLGGSEIRFACEQKVTRARSAKICMAADKEAGPAASETPVSRGMPLQQGSVPVQSGAQADQAKYKKPVEKMEGDMDAMAAAKLEISQLSENTELTEEQILKIRRMKKKVSKAAVIQDSQGFADAWSAANKGRLDFWFWIGLIFLLTPPAFLAWGVYTGIIPLE